MRDLALYACGQFTAIYFGIAPTLGRPPASRLGLATPKVGYDLRPPASAGRIARKEIAVLKRLVAFFGKRVGPECALCVRNWPVGSHVCPPNVVEYRAVRVLLAETL